MSEENTPNKPQAGTWVALPKQPKQARCRQNLSHLKPKRTYFWIIEATGHMCQDCVSARETSKAIEEGRMAGNPGNRGNNSPAGKSGKISRSKKAPVVIGAVLASRANGANKAQIARDLKISHNTVDKILDETEFDGQIALGRARAVGLIPEAFNAIEKDLKKGNGTLGLRFVEDMKVIGDGAKPGQIQVNQVLHQQIMNLFGPQPPAATLQIEAKPVETTNSVQLPKESGNYGD